MGGNAHINYLNMQKKDEADISEEELANADLEEELGEYDGSLQMAYDDYQRTELQAIINNQYNYGGY